MKTKIIMTIILFIFSYFYTYKCINFLKNNDSLMNIIKDNQDTYNINPYNAIITNNTMIPGIKGRVINLNKSYKKMKMINKFDESLLIYDYINPKISINNIFDKVIIRGNNKKNNVSIILNINEDELFNSLNKLLITNNIKVDILTNIDYNINNTNYVNIVNTNYSNKIDYCLTYTIKINKECQVNKKYTILGTIINNNHLTNTKEIINNGSILVYTFNKYNYQDFNIIIKFIKNNNYNIVSIDELIKE